MSEIWKDVPGYEGYYSVSSVGNVYSHLNGGRLLKQKTDKDGYKGVTLYKNGMGAQVKVHRLVAYAFIENDDLKKDQVNHKNEIKDDNRVENLEWVSCIENIRYGTGILRRAALNKKPIYCVETGVRFDSVKDAAEYIGRTIGDVSTAAQRGGIAGGYHWRYE